MKRFSFLAVLFAFMLVGSGCGPQSRPLQRPTTSPSGSSSAVMEANMEEAQAYLVLNGAKASVTREGGAMVDQPSGDFVLQAGDVISVMQGTASIVYPGVGMTQVEAGTSVTYVEDTEATGFLANLQLQAGRVWTRLDKVLGSGEGFSVSANGIVATVRGTGFGMSVSDSSDVDVQVAEHQVEVMPEEDLKLSPGQRKHAMMVKEGEGWQSNHGEMMKGDAMKKMRKLSKKEADAQGFLFAKRPIAAGMMKKRPDLKRKNGAAIQSDKMKEMMELLRMMKASSTAPYAGRYPSPV